MSGAELGVLKVADSPPVTALGVISSPTRIVTGYGNGNIRIWDGDAHAEENRHVRER